MAELERRTWAEILDEVKRRSGGKNYSGWEDRVKQFISAAYLDICSLYRHLEMETYEFVTMPTGKRSLQVALDTDLHHIIAVFEIEDLSTQDPTALLVRFDISQWAARFDYQSDGRPTHYTVTHSFDFPFTIRFNCGLDQTRYYIVYYQKIPDRPDFDDADAVPETGQHWDEHLIELSLAKLGAAIGDQELAAINAALFKDFVSQVAQPLLQTANASSTPEGVTTNKMSTGKNP